MTTSSVRPLRLAYSPCPNDTYIFHAWVHGLVPDAPSVLEILDDIDTLNAMALRGEPDVVKVSFPAFARLRPTYALLHSGGALGRGCGPLLVTRSDSPLAALSPEALPEALAELRTAIPGELTTAALLLRLFAPGAGARPVMTFDRIMAAVNGGEVEAGVIIHEGRFTYREHGLTCVLELGEWWESATGEAIPLGAIAVRRALGPEVARRGARPLQARLVYARRAPDASTPNNPPQAQEMDPRVCQEHIALYVNDFSLDYGEEGERAIRRLMAEAEAAGAVPAAGDERLFWDE